MLRQYIPCIIQRNGCVTYYNKFCYIIYLPSINFNLLSLTLGLNFLLLMIGPDINIRQFMATIV